MMNSRAATRKDRVNILGIGIHPVNMIQTIRIIEGWIEERTPNYVCLAAAHSLMACEKDQQLRRIFNRSGLTTPDGMPLVWITKLHGYREVSRVYGPDLMLSMCRRSVDQGYRHFLFGGEPGVAGQLALRLQERFPGLNLVGNITPPFAAVSPEEDQRLVDRINQAGPDVVWIGLGTGKQERWMAEHLGRILAPVMIGVGAAFDFLSGRKSQAPPWLRRMGLEWLFRLVHEPGRLWPRYRQYPRFVLLVLAQAVRLRRFSIE